VGERLRQCRLADAAGANDGHKLVQLDKGAQRQQILGAVGALPRVERVIDEMQIGTSGKPPYRLPPK